MDGATLLSDYRPWPFALDRVRLTFKLDPLATRVRAELALSPRAAGEPLHLDGEGLKLISIAIDGAPLAAADYALTDEGLTITAAALPSGDFTLTTEVEIAPEKNTALEGLYMSKGMYCTQNEAQGFRHITFYPDRPDVMARFHVRIEGDQPILLSNGNPAGRGEGWAEWDDPWPKPCYLFALVAGDLVPTHGTFDTLSGRHVDLNVWVRPGDEDRTAYALGAIQRSMKWDEERWGREYDLDVFNLVAVDDFNMGAMENKGLNVFNSKLVLASPETATDKDYERIEAVIGHEYFHNWTGDRITCRDWFQLCLKEGLTVFRDQSFTSDLRSQPVKRIEDVITLRARQFREDAGPLSHPPRPDHYREINNFYTATVYEKGAEVVRMLETLLGRDGFRKAMDLYFARHDGQACTIEDWIKVFEDSSGRDLTQFKLWYTDAGTPHLSVEDSFKDGVYSLTFTQTTAPTPGQPDKPARLIPIAVGLLGPNGDEVAPTRVLEMTEGKQTFTFTGLGAKPIPSILRGFSAPVILERQTSAAEQAFLLANDTDPFNRWEAGSRLGRDTLIAMTAGAAPASEYLDAIAALIGDETLDPAYRALILRLPAEDEIAQAVAASGAAADPDAIHAARKALGRALAERCEATLARIYDAMAVAGPYAPDPAPSGKRSLRLAALGLLSKLDGGARARALYQGAGDMTEVLGALNVLISRGEAEAELAAFRDKWQGNPLVIDKWFVAQLALCPPDEAAARAERLAADPLFTWKNPNRFRSLMGGLSANHAGFHAADGAGYRFYADWLLRLDPVNPQTAARLSTAFETWRRYDAGRQAKIRAELARIHDAPGLSRDLSEMLARMLG